MRPPRAGTLTRAVYDGAQTGVAASEMARTLGITHKHVASYLARLEARGLIETRGSIPRNEPLSLSLNRSQLMELGRITQSRGMTPRQLLTRVVGVLVKEPHLIEALLDE